MQEVPLERGVDASHAGKMLDKDDDPMCPCGMEDETLRHLWWRCPRWAYIRDKHLLSEDDYDALLVALREFHLLNILHLWILYNM